MHIFDLDQVLYGKEISVIPVVKLRDEVKFASFEALKKQIVEDAAQAKLALACQSVKDLI